VDAITSALMCIGPNLTTASALSGKLTPNFAQNVIIQSVETGHKSSKLIQTVCFSGSRHNVQNLPNYTLTPPALIVEPVRHAVMIEMALSICQCGCQSHATCRHSRLRYHSNTPEPGHSLNLSQFKDDRGEPLTCPKI